jgi:outer membrane lipoprotein-sorting protein
MADLHERESEFSQLLEGVPFDDSPRPEHAERLRELVLIQFDQTAGAAPVTFWWKRALEEGRELMRRPIPRLIAGTTVCLAIFAIWLLLPGSQSTAQAFNHFAEAIIKAKTARFQTEVTIEGQPTQNIRAWYLAPGKFRQDMGFMVNVSDLTTGRMVSLMPGKKKALVMNLKGAPKDKLANNYFERLRELLSGNRDAKDNQYQRLGGKEIDGRRAVGFRFDSPVATVTLWGDPKTGTPLRIENVWSGIPRSEVVMTHFEINVDLKESLFDLTPPADYKVQSFDVDASQSREQDLVGAFKSCSDIGGGEFPDTLDTASVSKLIIKYATNRGKDFSDDTVQQLMREAIKIGRGFQFAMELPESADAHYAGKGVKRGVKNRPIFWYKPDGAKEYRVLYADLTFRDASGAPQVAGAARIEKASKTIRPTK